jgi:hypothetical protein
MKMEVTVEQQTEDTRRAWSYNGAVDAGFEPQSYSWEDVPTGVLGVTSHRLLMVAGIPQVVREPYPKFEAPIRNAIQLEPSLRGVS